MCGFCDARDQFADWVKAQVKDSHAPPGAAVKNAQEGGSVSGGRVRKNPHPEPSGNDGAQLDKVECKGPPCDCPSHPGLPHIFEEISVRHTDDCTARASTSCNCGAFGGDAR